MNLYESIKKYGLNESVNYKGLYASSTPDEEPNKGGYFCQVYADPSMDNDVDDFVIHKEDLEHGEDYEALMLNYLQDNYYTIFRGVLKHFLKGVYGEYGKDYIFVDYVNGNTDLDSILDSVIASYADEDTSDHIGFYLQDLLNDPHGLLEIKTDLTESVITADDLTADVKKDLAIEPGSDEEYELDNLYALRDLDEWIESLYAEGLTSDEIKNKFAIDDIASHYGMSEEELDAKVDSFNESDELDSFESSYLKFYDDLVGALYQNDGYIHFPAREITSDELDALKKIVLSKGGEDLGNNKFSNDGIVFELSPKTGLTMTFDSSKDYKVEPINDAEIHTIDNDPSWAAAVSKVNAEHSKNKSKISNNIAKEYAKFTEQLTHSGLFKPEDVWKLPEGKAYRDAIKDPDDIWCECTEDTNSKFKPDGASYLGVSKHGYICNKCKKYTQIG